VALKVWSSFFYCPLTYKYFSYHFLLYICVGIFWETNNKYFCYHFFIVFLCCYIVVVITKGAFTYDVRCFGGIFDLPTYPNQMLYYISLFSQIRCSLTYLPTQKSDVICECSIKLNFVRKYLFVFFPYFFCLRPRICEEYIFFCPRNYWS
jgi:hypothetical protein